MPCTAEAAKFFASEGVIYCPGKAANAGGVAVSLVCLSSSGCDSPVSGFKLHALQFLYYLLCDLLK